MNLLSTSTLASGAALCAALAGCAGTTTPTSETVVRTRPPQGYEKTITSYFAFKVRGPQNDVAIDVGSPEPGACPLDGHLGSSRGWVVPVDYATRRGLPPGKDVVRITGRQYYFWFLGDTIAGVTPRVDLCPGTASVEFPQPGATVEGWLMAAASTSTSTSTRFDSRGRDGAAGAEPSKVGRAKTSTSSGKARQVAKKAGKKSKPGHATRAA